MLVLGGNIDSYLYTNCWEREIGKIGLFSRLRIAYYPKSMFNFLLNKSMQSNQ